MELNLKKRLILSLVLILFVVMALFVGIFVINTQILEKNIDTILHQSLIKRAICKVKNSTLIEKQLINGILHFHNEKKELKSEVESLNMILSNVYTKFKNKKNIKEILADIVKYTQTPCKCKYPYILDTKGNLIAYPPYLQYSMPSNIFETNIPSKEKFKTILKQAKNKKEVFISYKWIDPITSNTLDKLGFFKYFKPLEWILAESIYIPHVREHLLNEIVTLINVKYGIISRDGHFFLKDDPLAKEGLSIFNSDNILKIMYTTKIEALNVMLVSTKNISAIHKFTTKTNEYISSQIYNLLIEYILFGLIVFSIVIYCSNKTLDQTITKPIQSLIKQTEEILETEDITKKIQINTNDEFKILADEINKFLEIIRSRLEYYDKIVEKL